MNKYLICVIILLFSLCFFLQRRNTQINKERKILESNQSVLLNRADFYRTKDSLSVSSIERLTLSNNQLKESYSKLESRCNELNIKLNNVNSLSVSSTKNELKLSTPLRDTVIIRDSVIQTKYFHWENNWNRVEGLIFDNRVECSISSCDTLIQIVHRVPKKFLFLRVGIKSIKQEIISCNPSSTIIYNEYITLRNN